MFTVLVTGVMTASWLGAGFSAFLLKDAFEEEFKQRVSAEYNYTNWEAIVAILVSFSAVNLFTGLSMLQLATFHIWLRFHGLTTYQYHSNKKPKAHLRIASERTADSEAAHLESAENKGSSRRDPAYLSPSHVLSSGRSPPSAVLISG